MILNSRGLLGAGLGKNSSAQRSAAAVELPGSPLFHYNFTDIANLWQDASRTSAVTTDGQEVLGVTDLGSRAAHLSSTTGPLYKNSLTGGLDGLLYTSGAGTDVLYNTTGHNVTGNRMTMCVGRWLDNGTGNRYMYSFDTTHCTMLMLTGDTIRFYNSTVLGDDLGDPGSGVDFATIQIDNTDDTGSNHHSQVAVQNHTVTHADTSSKPITIGAQTSAGGQEWDGWISEWAQWNGTLPAKADVVAYILSKYGITFT